jgi:hypothetical protein
MVATRIAGSMVEPGSLEQWGKPSPKDGLWGIWSIFTMPRPGLPVGYLVELWKRTDREVSEAWREGDPVVEVDQGDEEPEDDGSRDGLLPFEDDDG